MPTNIGCKGIQAKVYKQLTTQLLADIHESVIFNF